MNKNATFFIKKIFEVKEKISFCFLGEIKIYKKSRLTAIGFFCSKSYNLKQMNDFGKIRFINKND
jgi:hypothetical protein